MYILITNQKIVCVYMRQKEIGVVEGMWGPLGAYQGFLPLRDHSSSLMLSRAESRGGEVKIKIMNYFAISMNFMERFLGSLFSWGTHPFFPLGYETALRVPDALFHSWKMATIIATS